MWFQGLFADSFFVGARKPAAGRIFIEFLKTSSLSTSVEDRATGLRNPKDAS
jgi:hypothetical protein